jgi:hypothetical protein
MGEYAGSVGQIDSSRTLARIKREVAISPLPLLPDKVYFALPFGFDEACSACASDSSACFIDSLACSSASFA